MASSSGQLPRGLPSLAWTGVLVSVGVWLVAAQEALKGLPLATLALLCMAATTVVVTLILLGVGLRLRRKQGCLSAHDELLSIAIILCLPVGLVGLTAGTLLSRQAIPNGIRYVTPVKSSQILPTPLYVEPFERWKAYATETAKSLKIPTPELSVLSVGVRQAGYDKSMNKLYVTDAMLNEASPDILKAVLAHEMGHALPSKGDDTSPLTLFWKYWPAVGWGLLVSWAWIRTFPLKRAANPQRLAFFSFLFSGQTVLFFLLLVNVNSSQQEEELRADRCAVMLVGGEQWEKTVLWLANGDKGNTWQCATSAISDHPCWKRRLRLAQEPGVCSSTTTTTSVQ